MSPRWVIVALAAGLVAADPQPVHGIMLYPGETGHATFAIRVPEPTTVTGVSSTCACIAASTLPPVLEPTRDQPWTLLISTRDDDTGAISGSGWIRGSAGGRDTLITCTYDGEVRDLIAWPWSGSVVDLGRMRSDGADLAVTASLRRGTHPEPWDSCTVAVEGDPAIDAAQTPGADGSWTLRATVHPGGVCGVLSSRLTWSFATGGRALGYHPSRVLRAIVDGPVSAQPHAALIGAVAAGATRRIPVWLAGSGADGRIPAIVRLAPSDPALVAASADAAGRIDLAFTASGPPRQANGHLDAHFADGTILRIPWIARIIAAP